MGAEFWALLGAVVTVLGGGGGVVAWQRAQTEKDKTAIESSIVRDKSVIDNALLLLKTANAEIERLLTRSTEEENRRREADDRLSDVEHRLAVAESDLSEMRAALAASKDEREELAQLVEELEELVAQLRAQIAMLTEERDIAVEERQEVLAHLVSVEQELAEAKELHAQEIERASMLNRFIFTGQREPLDGDPGPDAAAS